MGKKAKKAMKKNLKRASFNKNPSEDADFLPLEGGPARKLAGQQKPPPPPENTATVLYVGRIPHGFYEKEMEAKIVADTMHNYLLFEHLLQVYVIPPEHVHPRIWRGFNYHYKPLDSVQIERKRHDKVSRSMNKKVYLLDIVSLILSIMFCSLLLSFQDRTLEEHKKLVEKVLKHDQKRRKRIEAAGIDYECPEIVGNIQPAPKKIKFED
ncbi:hypothetical protein JHK82_024725 [Glycine max]|nr:hypothetical protein JHK82_024725 [Glycine max]